MFEDYMCSRVALDKWFPLIEPQEGLLTGLTKDIYYKYMIYIYIYIYRDTCIGINVYIYIYMYIYIYICIIVYYLI